MIRSFSRLNFENRWEKSKEDIEESLAKSDGVLWSDTEKIGDGLIACCHGSRILIAKETRSCSLNLTFVISNTLQRSFSVLSEHKESNKINFNLKSLYLLATSCNSIEKLLRFKCYCITT